MPPSKRKRPPCIMCGKDAKRLSSKTCSSECHSKLASKNSKEKWLSGESKINTGNVGIKGYYYKGIYLRSSWELEFAKYADSKGLVWTYEETRFDLGDCVYIPDFHMTECNMFIEIKGWAKPKFLEKMDKMEKLHPNVNLLVVQRPPPYNWIFD